MSDDDRIDRAERIRNMRQGSRSTDEETDDEEPDHEEATDETAADDDTPEHAEASETTGDATAAPADDTEQPSPTETTTVESSTADTTPAENPVGGDEAIPEPSTADEDDPEAIAQRAAAAAAETMGDDSGVVDQSASAVETAQIQGPDGVALPDKELLEAAMANAETESVDSAARAAAGANETTSTEEKVRVLEFALGDEYYCLDIEYVEEIVKRDAVTRVPNTPDFVDGVVDLRGQITTILEPKEMMDIDSEGSQDLIVVFDPDQFEDHGAVGWVVDEVRQVVPVGESEVNSPPVDAEYINGVVDRDEYDQFVIWVEPDDALKQAANANEN